MKKRIVIVVLAAAALVAAALWRAGAFYRLPADRILLSGNLELTEVDLSFKTPGRIVELRVGEGDAVKKGQLLARIDPDQLQKTRVAGEAAMAAAHSGLTQLRTAILYQKEAIGGDLELRQAELRQAEARLAEMLAGSRPQEIQQARALVAEARTAHEQAARDWERAQTLYKNEDISTAQRDQFRARFDQTAAALRQAEQKLALVEEGPRQEEIEMARAAVERGRAALRLSRAANLELRRREEELDARRAEIDRTRAQLAVIDSQLGDTAVVSPIDGVVLVKSAETGEVLAAGASVLKLGDLDRPWLRGYIGERDLGRVKLGQKVRLKTDSYPHKDYWGRVSFIASEAEFTPKQIQTPEERVKLVYRVKIEVDNRHRELKSNMPVDAEILLDAK
jgi:HlyD family secretion protein